MRARSVRCKRIADAVWDFGDQSSRGFEDLEQEALLLDRDQRRTADPKVRAVLLVALGTLRRDRLGDAHGAYCAFEEAVDLDPDNVEALLALVDSKLERCEWSEVARLVERLMGSSPQRALDPLRKLLEALPEAELGARADAHHRLGTIYTTLGDPRRARLAWERALVIDPHHAKTLASLLDVAFAERNLESASELGDRLLATTTDRSTRLGMLRALVKCWTDLDGQRADSHRRRTIGELLAAIDADPLEPALHHELHLLFLRAGELDRAFCVAAVLVFLKAADSDERACFAEHRPKGVPHFRSALTRSIRARHLAHPELDRDLSAIFAILARAVRTTKGRTARLPPYAGSGREDPRSTTRVAAKAFFGAANVLGIAAPELLVRPELPSLLNALPLEAPTTLMGGAALGGWSVPELFFLAGKHLLAQHGEHGVRATSGTTAELSTLRDAAIEVVQPGTFSAQVRRVADVLARELTRPEGVELAKAIEAASDVETAGVARWVRASELTALRAGLLLCGDLSIAAKIVRHEPPAGPAANEKVKELVRFAVSADYHALRCSLGIAVDRRVPDDDDEPTIERKLCA